MTKLVLIMFIIAKILVSQVKMTIFVSKFRFFQLKMC